MGKEKIQKGKREEIGGKLETMEKFLRIRKLERRAML